MLATTVILATVLSGTTYIIDPPLQWIFGYPPSPRAALWGIDIPDEIPDDTTAVDVQAWIAGGNTAGEAICTGRLFLYGPDAFFGTREDPANPAIICYTHLAVRGEGERSTCTGMVPIYTYTDADGVEHRIVIGWWDTLVNNKVQDSNGVGCFSGFNVTIRGGLLDR